MEKNIEKFIKSYLSNIQVFLNVAAYTKCPEDWKDADFKPDYSKFYYIKDGEGSIKIDGKEFYPKPGDLCLLPAGRLQSYSTISKNTFTKYWCHFSAMVGEISLFDIIHVPYFIQVNDKDEMDYLFRSLVYEYENQNIEAALMTKSILLRLIARYIQLAGLDKIELPNSVSWGKILQVLKYIDENISRNITVEELAEITHFHPNYFIRFFRKHLGVSPAHYIYKKRMERSKNLLSIKDLSITQISQENGFNNLYHFSKAFKSYTGYSPTEYRKLFYIDT